MVLNKVITALLALFLCSVAFGQGQGDIPGTVEHVICDSGCSGGAGGGGVAQLQVRNAGDTAWVNVGINGADLSVPVVLQAGAAVIGHVIVDTAPTTAVTGTFWPYTLGQQLAAASVPIVLTASQLSTLTPPAAFNGVVTNAGTFATQATLAAETTKVIGTINVAAAQTIGLAASSAVIGHVINDASSAVIGHVINDSGSTTAVTQATGTNLHAVIDTGSTTAVTQATGTNLHTVVDSGAIAATLAAETTKVIGTINIAAAQTIGLAAGSAVIGHVIVDTAPSTAVTNTGTFAVQATLAAETTKVIGTARILGNTGATVDAAPGAALPTNTIVAAGRDSTQTGGGAAVPVVCDKSAAITAGAAATTIVIALTASKTTYICGFVVTGAGAAGTMQWKSGTGTTCGTGTANLTGAMATAIGVAVLYGNGFGTIMRHASAAQDTCITMATASATAAGIVSYAQF